MMQKIIAFTVGGLFGVGLYISQMTNTLKVQGWLDVFGKWDPTLTFVMGGAIIPMVVAWRVADKRTKSFLGENLPPPAKTEINKPLIVGSICFGAGWGLSGLCPGPAIASLSFGGLSGIIFFISMLTGMLAVSRLTNKDNY
jgi:uncharacterized membrane protein YedE/YeeE